MSNSKISALTAATTPLAGTELVPLVQSGVTKQVTVANLAVTSVGLAMPTQFAVTGSPVTTTGTLTAAWNTQTANTVLAGPTTGAAAAPTFRSLVAGDIPALSYVTSVGATAPITSTGGLTPTIGVTAAALTKTDDTNVTLTLGGSPTTALLAATSLTLGWTGTLSPARGGTGVDNSTRTLTINTNSGTLAFTNASTTLTIANTGSISGTNTGDVTLATNSGLAFTSGQTGLALGTPSNVTSSSTNSVTTNTHTHAITAGLGFIGNGTAQNQVPVTGATPFAPTWTSISSISGQIDHNTLSNLTTGDVHTQYAFLAGRVGNQTLIGGTASAGTLTLQSTANATRGKILFGTSAYDEANNRLGVGTTSPTDKLTVVGSVSAGSVVTRITNSFGDINSAATISLDPNGNGFNVRDAQIRGINVNGVTQAALGFYTANGATPVEAMRISHDGNVGIGVTPAAWIGYRAIGLNNQGAYYYALTASSTSGLSGNGYYNGTNWIYSNSQASGRYEIAGAQHSWFTAPSGTAGNAITFVESMRIDNAGNVGIGNSNPTNKLDVLGSVSAGSVVTRITNSFGNTGSSAVLSLDPNGNGFNVRDAQIRGVNVNGVTQTALAFYVSNGSTPVEAMRVAHTGDITIADGRNFIFSTTTGTKIGTGTTQKIGFYNATPIVRPSAYTQTYSTASKTMAARTAAALTDNTGGTVSTTLAAITAGATYTQADMVAVKNALASIADQINKLRTDGLNTADVANQIIDDLQALGLVG